MQEHHVTVGGQTHVLQEPSWWWPRRIPSNKKARIRCLKRSSTALFEINIGYPSTADEEQIVLNTSKQELAPRDSIEPRDFLGMQRLIRACRCRRPWPVIAWRWRAATRPTNGKAPEVTRKYVEWAAAARVANVAQCGQGARAAGRASRADCGDVTAVALPTLRHRIIPNYHAVGEGLTTATLIGDVEAVPMP